jgi:putative ATP-binding cassette transporter
MSTDLHQPLLHEPSLGPEATDSAQERSPRSNATPSQLAVLKFIFLTPMSCSFPVAFLLLLLGVCSSAAVGILLALTGKELGNINTSFQNQDVALFDVTIRNVIIYVLLTVAMQGLATFCMKHIGLMKRIHLNQTLHSIYMKDKCFYILNAFHSDHCDSIDSRLTSDIETMTSELYSILQTVVMQVTAFIYSMTLLSSDTVALIALLCLCLFSVLVYGILNFVFQRTSSFVSQLKKDEGSFIFQHTRIKKNSESIAFYSGQDLELEKIKLIFDAVLQSYRKVIKSQMALDFLGNFYNTGNMFVIWIGKRHPCTIQRLNHFY